MIDNARSPGDLAPTVKETLEAATGNIFSRVASDTRRRTLFDATQYRRNQLDRSLSDLVIAIDESHEAIATLESERIRTDPAERRRGSLPWAVAVTIAVALIDILPAYWAAEALGENARQTQVVAAILVIGLTGFAWLISHFQHRRDTRSLAFAILFTGLLIGTETALRARYLLVVTNARVFDMALEAGLLAAISGGLVWIGYVKLIGAEPYGTWRMRLTTESFRRNVEDLRNQLVVASSDYTKTWEALRAFEAGRVGRDVVLNSEIDQEMRLWHDLMKRLRTTIADPADRSELIRPSAITAHDDLEAKGPIDVVDGAPSDSSPALA